MRGCGRGGPEMKTPGLKKPSTKKIDFAKYFAELSRLHRSIPIAVE
jgi:hypothetical protein